MGNLKRSASANSLISESSISFAVKIEKKNPLQKLKIKEKIKGNSEGEVKENSKGKIKGNY